MSGKPRILRPTAEAAERAILVGDPGRALLLATELLETPAPMFNHHRGLWGYCGPAADGSGRLMVQGTGVGGPSLNAVTQDLSELGVTRVVRLGTATSASLNAGTLVVASTATGGPSVATSPNPGLLERAGAAFPDADVGAVISADFHLQPTVKSIPLPAIAADLSTATLYATAGRLGLAAVSVLLIVESARDRSTDAEVELAMKAIAPTALQLLS